ncbi:MAG: hypothetical protein BWY66_02611 [bacterium ADurb.Bin374]|nr:MAG: hypothetical protein BWY66_02611 [bacterium ADurb.Bin374]
MGIERDLQIRGHQVAVIALKFSFHAARAQLEILLREQIVRVVDRGERHRERLSHQIDNLLAGHGDDVDVVQKRLQQEQVVLGHGPLPDRIPHTADISDSEVGTRGMTHGVSYKRTFRGVSADDSAHQIDGRRAYDDAHLRVDFVLVSGDERLQLRVFRIRCDIHRNRLVLDDRAPPLDVESGFSHDAVVECVVDDRDKSLFAEERLGHRGVAVTSEDEIDARNGVREFPVIVEADVREENDEIDALSAQPWDELCENRHRIAEIDPSDVFRERNARRVG